MPAQPGNALNITQTGLVLFDGTATFTATTTTQYNTLVGNTGNTIANIAPGTATWVLTSNGAAANPSYQVLPFTPLTWTDEAVSFPAVANNAYFVSAIATATLPGSPTQGQTISFTVDTTAILTIQANTGQIIRIGKAVSATAGTADSNFQGDSVTLVYRTSDTAWIAESVLGTWTVT